MALLSLSRRSLAFLFLLLAVPHAVAESGISKEYLIKAAFLFNFAQFIEWPPERFADPDAPIRIGILGDDPFGAAIDDTIAGETVRNRKLTVERSARAEDLMDCHLVYVSKSEKGDMTRILKAFESAAIVTVSDIEGFAGRGGIIDFYLDGKDAKKVRFEINAAAAQARNLKLSAQLLGLGKIVTTNG